MIVLKQDKVSKLYTDKLYGREAKPSRVKEIIALIKEGMNQGEIADALGMKQKALSHYMRSYGMKMPRATK